MKMNIHERLWMITNDYERSWTFMSIINLHEPSWTSKWTFRLGSFKWPVFVFVCFGTFFIKKRILFEPKYFQIGKKCLDLKELNKELRYMELSYNIQILVCFSLKNLDQNIILKFSVLSKFLKEFNFSNIIKKTFYFATCLLTVETL